LYRVKGKTFTTETKNVHHRENNSLDKDLYRASRNYTLLAQRGIAATKRRKTFTTEKNIHHRDTENTEKTIA
jgi:hypothetical protein